MNSNIAPKLRTGLALAAMALLVGLSACKGRKDTHLQSLDPAFGEYVAAHTSGLVPAQSTIKLLLAQPSPHFESEGSEAPSRLFELQPSVKGRAVWTNNQTVEFIPAEPLKSGERYKATVQLHKLFDIKEQQLREMVFGFRVIPQALSVDIEGLVVDGPENPHTYYLEGTLRTADQAEHDALLQCVKAQHNGRSVEVSLQSSDEANAYRLRIGGIERETQAGELNVRWDAAPIGSDSEGGATFNIPAMGRFTAMASSCEQAPNQAAVVYFSDLIDTRQNLQGLVELDGQTKLRYRIDRNVLRVYPSQSINGVGQLKVNIGVQSASGHKLTEEFRAEHLFESIKPSIRPVGAGVVLPTSEGLSLPFEAVNVRSVMVEVIKIYENNIPYYLQHNRLGGTSELHRVGYPVLKKAVDLSQGGVVVPNVWQRYHIDLKTLFSADAGAMYQIKVSFNKHQLLSPCEGVEPQQPSEQIDYSPFADDDAGYFNFAYSDNYYDDDYDWRLRDDPCNSAYYTNDNATKFIRTIISSDIGLLAKQGSNGELLVVANNIPTGRPQPGVAVRVSDFQNQTLAEGSTNSEGMVQLQIAERRAYLITASHNGQNSYLRVDNASAHPLSNFDVGGAEVQRGLKGLIYGERGVWRPGDTLHLCFMLEDKGHSIPNGHPVVLEVHDARGALVKRMVRSHTEAGLYYFPVNTDPQAPTGHWRATVQLGGATFGKTLRVESIKPNRLKMQLALQNDRIPPSGNIDANLNVRWLHGATAGNTKVRYEMTVSKAHARFEGHGQYTFDDPGIGYPAQTKPLWEGTTNAQGQAHLFGSIERSRSMPAALNVRLNGRAYEPGGDFSIDLQSLTYHPYSEFVGLIAPQPNSGRHYVETDADQQVSLATVDAQGKPVSCSNLVVELYKTSWSWWWEQPSSGEASYISQSHEQLVLRTKASTQNGRGTATIRVNAPDWGRYYLKVTNRDNGNSCGTFVYFDWPYSSGQAQGNRPGGATVLSLATDKLQYSIDDDIKLTFPGMERARALISIENGSRVLSAYWVDASQSSNVVAIKVQPAMAPNIYVHVTLVQPHNEKSNDLPIRMFGVVPLNISNPQTELKPVISMPDELKSESPVSIVVREAQGKKMTFSLAVVDEGLLDINRYQTPNPHSAFYAREALGVRTWDLYNDVIGAYGGKLERLLSIGGSDDAAETNPAQGQTLRFTPVVRFFGPYTVDNRRSQKIDFNMPNYAGSVRVMVVAGHDGAYGAAEKTCPVRNDVMLMATMPRVLGPNEEISLPVNIFASNPDIKQVKVKVKTSDNISINGSDVQTLQLSGANNEQLAHFALKVGSTCGPARVEISAEGNKGGRSSQVIDIEVRNPISEETRTQHALIASDSARTFTLSPFGIAGSNRASIELSAMPPLNLEKRIHYLVNYPHGCAEQTTSAAFPQLYLKQLLDLNAQQEERIATHVAAAIKRLGMMQLSNGGFGYWPGATRVDEWSTSYVGHFMLAARNAGYDVPQGLLDSWLSYQRIAARQYAPPAANSTLHSTLVQAYRLYTLALAGKPEVGAMNKLKERDMDPIAVMRLASAYAIIGQENTATRMLADITIGEPDYSGPNRTYGSARRDAAIVLETMLLLKYQEQAFPMALELSRELASDTWLSTQETAVILSALSKMAIGDGLKSNLKAQYTLNGQKRQLQSDKPIVQATLDQLDEGQQSRLEVAHSHGQPLYATIVMTGIPSQGHERDYDRNLNLNVRYMLPNGTAVNPSSLKQGTDFVCEVTVSNPSQLHHLHELALTQIFPSGWEIRNTRLESDEANGSTQFDYQDIRDDRVLTYFDLPAGQSKTFTVQLSATYAGRFYMPGPNCQAMYNNEVAAAKSGTWVRVE